jgi:hypothetical protein
MHQKHETLYVANFHSNVVHQLGLGDTGEKKKKRVQFAIVFYLLKEGCPLTDYGSLKDFFYFFKVKNMPKKHLSNNLSWEVAESIHDVVLEHTKKEIKESPFLVLFVDKVITSHIESWISIHGHVLENWQRIPILLNLEKVTNVVTIENIYNVMLQTLLIQGGLTKVEIGKTLVSIGANGRSMFIGCRISVSMRMKEKLAPYLVVVHCCAHHTNLTIQTFSSLSIVHRLEDLLQSFHSYFARSLKRVLEL